MMRRRLLPGGSSRGQRMSASPPRGFGYTSVESTYRSAAVHGREICAVRERSTLALSKPRAGEALIRCPRLEPPGGTRNAHRTSRAAMIDSLFLRRGFTRWNHVGL